MIQVQVICKENENLKSLIRAGIQGGTIKAFQIRKVQGGLQIQHKKFLGGISIKQIENVLVAILRCKNKTKEWQLLESFVGRLAYHFQVKIASINIQFE